MMKKVFAAAMAVTLSVLFTACSSVTTGTNLHDMKLSESNDLQTIAHLNGDVWGIYLFGILPLFTGSTATPGSCAVFKDTVRLDNAVSMLSKKAAALDFCLRCIFCSPIPHIAEKTNGNLNGLLKEPCPKDRDCRVHHPRHKKYPALINARLKKFLHFQTPQDLFKQDLIMCCT